MAQKRRVIPIRFLEVILVLGLFTACESVPNGADKLVSAFCDELTGCYVSLSTRQCVEDLQSLDLTDELSLAVPENTLPMEQLSDAIDAGDILVDDDQVEQCIAEVIQPLECADWQAHLGDAPVEDYSNLENIFPEEENPCQKAFTLAE